jgi:hypothetical protein
LSLPYAINFNKVSIIIQLICNLLIVCNLKLNRNNPKIKKAPRTKSWCFFVEKDKSIYSIINLPVLINLSALINW